MIQKVIIKLVTCQKINKSSSEDVKTMERLQGTKLLYTLFIILYGKWHSTGIFLFFIYYRMTFPVFSLVFYPY